ncbi:DUF2249 domain-containing protein, partial [Thermus hydrothermalis]|uniref:DUF2249 domain-containing protein n=1 Tax=Thermus hydrothermalis TaxID=2908148 RepID=UPI001FAA2627
MELDVRPIPPRERHPRIFGVFDSLEPGESFVLVNSKLALMHPGDSYARGTT